MQIVNAVGMRDVAWGDEVDLTTQEIACPGLDWETEFYLSFCCEVRKWPCCLGLTS